MSSPADGYLVYPETLRQATNDLFDAVDVLSGFANTTLPNLTIDDGALGLLGRIAGTVDAYNSAVHKVGQRTLTGANRLRDIAEALDKSADFYEAQDAEYFEQMKKFQKDLN